MFVSPIHCSLALVQELSSGVTVGVEGVPALLSMDIGLSSGARCCPLHLASPMSSVMSPGLSGLLHPPSGLTTDSVTGCSSCLVPNCHCTLGFRRVDAQFLFVT